MIIFDIKISVAVTIPTAYAEQLLDLRDFGLRAAWWGRYEEPQVVPNIQD